MNSLVGVWRLERWTSGSAQPFGPAPQGTLVYTAQGTMISCFMRRGRAPIGPQLAAWRRYALGVDQGTEDPETARRFAAAAIAFNSYSGRYSTEGTRVHHDVEIALFPDWIGRRLTRSFHIDGAQLTLSFDSDALVWRR